MPQVFLQWINVNHKSASLATHYTCHINSKMHSPVIDELRCCDALTCNLMYFCQCTYTCSCSYKDLHVGDLTILDRD